MGARGLGLVRPAQNIPPRVARRAVEWLVELQSGQATEATRLALRRWLGEHPDHSRAWQHIETVNGRLHEMGTSAGATSSLVHATLAPPRSARRRDAVKALTVLFFAGGGAWLAREAAPWPEWLADERTGVGERRTLRLADGSRVDLNTGSAVNVRFSATERRLLLAGGEILVATGKAPGFAALPFIVETPQGELRPLGTRFAVRLLEGGGRLDVFEGAVAIHPRDGASRTLGVGEQARFTRQGVDAPAPAHEAATAWTDGMLVASGMRLDDFLAELARHRPGRLACDPAVAGLRVSGSYPLGDTDRILAALGSSLPVDVRFLTRYWVTVMPRAAR